MQLRALLQDQVKFLVLVSTYMSVFPMQETGRAGRDGKPAYCHLFLDDKDYLKLRSLAHRLNDIYFFCMWRSQHLPFHSQILNLLTPLSSVYSSMPTCWEACTLLLVGNLCSCHKCWHLTDFFTLVSVMVQMHSLLTSSSAESLKDPLMCPSLWAQ